MRTDSRHELFATSVGCTVDQVEAAFGFLFGFGMWAAERSEKVIARREAAALNAIAKDLDRSIRRIASYNGSRFQPLGGLPTKDDLCALRDYYKQEAGIAAHFTNPQAYPATKGRSEQALIVAEAVAHLFVSIGLDVRKGTSQHDGEPTSRYGKAVKKALDIYGVNANWRQPAKAAAAFVNSNTN